MREEHVVGFRIVGLQPGSAVLELEPLLESNDSEIAAEPLAIENLRSLVRVLEDHEEPLDPDVTQSVEAARRALGEGGTISLELRDGAQPTMILIDERRIEDLAARKPRREEIVAQVHGLLTMVDIEPPFRVAIRAQSGIRWNCRYDPTLEEQVTSLLKHQVFARGAGVRVNTRRGYFEIESLEAVPEFEQSPLFSVERRPLAELLREQRVGQPQGWRAFADPEWNDDDPQSESYLRSLLAKS